MTRQGACRHGVGGVRSGALRGASGVLRRPDASVTRGAASAPRPDTCHCRARSSGRPRSRAGSVACRSIGSSRRRSADRLHPDSRGGGQPAHAALRPTRVNRSREDAEVLVTHRNLVDGADERGSADVRLPVVSRPGIAHLIPRRDHRVLETRVHEILFVGAV